MLNIFESKINPETGLKLTEIIFTLPFISALFIHVDDDTPEVVDDNKRRRQRRFVMVLLGQTVSVETPRLYADVLHRLKRVAATITTS